MAKKENRAALFKMFLNQKALIDSLPDAKVGQALKAAYQYFEDGTVPQISPLAFTLFSSIKPYVDESFTDFEAASKKNRANIKQRWAKCADTSGTSGIQSLPLDTTDTEAEADTPYGVDASLPGEKTNNGDAAFVGGPPVRFYYDPVQGKTIDREEAQH